MKHIFWALVTLVALLAACGGGDNSVDYIYEAPPSYGSIAVNTTTKFSFISYNYDSESGASDSALSRCGSGCVTVLNFGSLQCGALAKGSNGAFGWASDKKETNAKNTAISQCVTYSGLNCVVVLSGCNGS